MPDALGDFQDLDIFAAAYDDTEFVMPQSPVIGALAWLQLLHAEVCWSLADAGISCLIIKGPSVADWLYQGEERESVDVDVLVAPSQFSAAEMTLRRRGFVGTYDGTRQGEIGGAHAFNMNREDSALGYHSVDLHYFFPGIDLDPARAFDALWIDRVHGSQAGRPVWYPSLEARALIVALHAARSPDALKAHRDLERMVAWADSNGWRPVVALAERICASSALRAGLDTLEGSRAIIERAGLTDVVVSPVWKLRSTSADRTALRLESIGEMTWRERPGQLFRLLVPSPELMRHRDHRAAEGSLGLARAYVVRLGQGARSLPGAIRAVRAARKHN